MGNGTFILYDVDLESLEFLTREQIGDLFIALRKYRLGGVTPDFGNDSTLKVIYHQITKHIALNEEKYTALTAKRSQAAKKRWSDKDAKECKAMQSNAKQCLYDTDTVTDTVTDTATVTDTVTVTDTDTVACGAPKKTKERKNYNKKNKYNEPKLLKDEPAYDIDAFLSKAINLKYEKTEPHPKT